MIVMMMILVMICEPCYTRVAMINFSFFFENKELRNLLLDYKELARLICFWCVCTFIHREGFICLNQLGNQGTNQGCYVEDVNVLCQVPSSLR